MYEARAHTFPLNNTFYDTRKEKEQNAWKCILKTDRIQLFVKRMIQKITNGHDTQQSE